MTTSEDHPSLDKLRQYFDGELPDFQECLLENHLSECEHCTAALQRLDMLLYSGFTAREHAAAAAAEANATVKDPLAAALRRALESAAEFAAPLGEWLAGAAAIWGTPQLRAFGFGASPASASSTTGALQVDLPAGENRAQIRISEMEQDVEVRAGAAETQLALLFDASEDAGEDAAVFVAAFQNEAGGRLCVFPDVPQGDYYLAIFPS